MSTSKRPMGAQGGGKSVGGGAAADVIASGGAAGAAGELADSPDGAVCTTREVPGAARGAAGAGSGARTDPAGAKGGETGPAGAEAVLRYLLRLGDTSLVLGQRLGEWIGHAPALEEDLGLANLALDLVGQARLLLSYAAEVEGKGRDEDALAFFRDAPQFMNMTLAEQPNGDFAQTIVRQVLLDAWQLELYEGLSRSADTRLAAIAAKAVKESRYHFRFSSGWVVRLGDGTEESHRRAQNAVDNLWRFTDELFTPDEIDEQMAAAGVAPHLSSSSLVGRRTLMKCCVKRRCSARRARDTHGMGSEVSIRST